MKYLLLFIACLSLKSIAISQTVKLSDFEALYAIKTLNERVDFIKKIGFNQDSSSLIDGRVKAINFSKKLSTIEYIRIYDYPDQDSFSYWTDVTAGELHYYPQLSQAYKPYEKETFPKFPNNYRQRFMKLDKKKNRAYYIEVSKAVDGNPTGFFISYGSNFND